VKLQGRNPEHDTQKKFASQTFKGKQVVGTFATYTTLSAERTLHNTGSTKESSTRIPRVIDTLTRRRGIAPTLTEIAVQLGVSATRARQLARLCVERGRLTHERRVARSWRIVPPAQTGK
jgi:DNA-directed RNA polymerase specialized sigma subunit